MHKDELEPTKELFPEDEAEEQEEFADEPLPAAHLLTNWLLDLRAVEKPLQWPAIFQNDRPVELEVGCGTGLFLSKYAADHQELNLIGIDKCTGLVFRTAQKTRRLKLENVKLLRFEALFFLQDYIPQGGLHALHCYYSDPWPKRSHHRRRVWQKPFLEAAHKALQAEGRLYMKTDVTEYFLAIQKAFASVPELFTLELDQRLDEVPLAGDYESNYQLKARRKGHPLHYQIWRKRS